MEADVSVSMTQCDECGEEYPVVMDRCPGCDQKDTYADLRREQGIHPLLRALVWLLTIAIVGMVFYGLHRIINAPHRTGGGDNPPSGDLERGTLNAERLRAEGVVACAGALDSSPIATSCDTLDANTPMRGTPLGCFCDMVFQRNLRKRFCEDLVQPIHEECFKRATEYPDPQGAEVGYNDCVVSRLTQQLGPALDQRAKRCGVKVY
jgi:hypothetical protein